ncbi:alkaline phosphatase family protein, partial [bacterium]|nr:alkaline phosphatase family protein [bacterium]
KTLAPKSVEPIAKDLQAFLKWLIDNKKSYEEVIAAPFPSDSIKDEVASLPIWQYQKYLNDRVKNSNLSYSVADRRLSAVRHFYLWSYKRSVISSLPFSMEYKAIKIPKKNRDFDLFSLPNSVNKRHKGIENWVSNLGISKTSIQPDAVPNQLQPYSPSELASLLTTNISKHRTYGLFLKCAYLGGFRSFEVIKINHSDICDPKKDNFSKFYNIYINRKGNKNDNILISPNLMNMLYQYTLDPSWSIRRVKFESIYGINTPNAPLPLFINSSGERMAEEAPSSTIGYIRLEQRDRGEYVIERDYHDLRSTFGTYLAMAMIINGESEQRVKSVLMKLFSHESFAISEQYLDFAKIMLDESEHGAMHHWVKDMYSSVDELLAKILKKCDEKDYNLVLTSDHGNCEQMKDDNGKVLTNH